MFFTDEQYSDLKSKFTILLHTFIFVVKKYKYCCDHFLFAAYLLDDLHLDFSAPKDTHCALTILSKIEYLLRTLKRIEALQNHATCRSLAFN